MTVRISILTHDAEGVFDIVNLNQPWKIPLNFTAYCICGKACIRVRSKRDKTGFKYRKFSVFLFYGILRRKHSIIDDNWAPLVTILYLNHDFVPLMIIWHPWWQFCIFDANLLPLDLDLTLAAWVCPLQTKNWKQNSTCACCNVIIISSFYHHDIITISLYHKT